MLNQTWFLLTIFFLKKLKIFTRLVHPIVIKTEALNDIKLQFSERNSHKNNDNTEDFDNMLSDVDDYAIINQ